MADEPFSLLLPVYFRDDPEHFRLAFKSSVLDQTRAPDEVVLVQDGPIPPALDEAISESVEASPVPVTRVRLAQNVGLAVALEKGLEACRHGIVARMDADDVSLPDRFARQLEVLATGVDIVGTGMLEFLDDTKVVSGRRVPPTGQQEIVRYSRFHDPFNHPTVVYRKAAVRKAGGYQPLGLMEDYWLFVRMIDSGAKVANLPDPLVMYRVGAGAYNRRGGLGQFRAELRLQRLMRGRGFTTRSQYARNLVTRGLYRFLPVAVRKVLYQRIIVRNVPHG
ncbi:glycosyltransferase [Naasia aerilata]|uniref:Glycosyl hydrolase n=1 Tax=Naasia aerilata TaxID=1162966 RepID=A0ABM8GCC8_9MICO|nr:glycosyltransferase [Naasia aerilata]BDZ45903.1 glycosyl hydrolase [Naasia aerilata]